MHDYDNETTQSESEGSDIDEPFGFSGKCTAHYKNPGENPVWVWMSSRLPHRLCCWSNSKHNRVSACRALLDWSSKKAIIQRTLHLTCIKQPSLVHSPHHATSRSKLLIIGALSTTICLPLEKSSALMRQNTVHVHMYIYACTRTCTCTYSATKSLGAGQYGRRGLNVQSLR